MTARHRRRGSRKRTTKASDLDLLERARGAALVTLPQGTSPSRRRRMGPWGAAQKVSFSRLIDRSLRPTLPPPHSDDPPQARVSRLDDRARRFSTNDKLCASGRRSGRPIGWRCWL